MFAVQQTLGSLVCCKCGTAIYPNAANMCVKCLSSEVDITGGLLKHVTIIKCPECLKYLQPPKTWVSAQPESSDLLTFCIKRLNLDKAKVRLAHADWVWTEPHSKRIKIKLKIRKEVLNGVVLEQAYIVEYVVQEDHNCDACTRILADPDQWVASVQLRQRVPHMRTFFSLEQAILKHDAASQTIGIQQKNEGVDFFFSNRSHALRFVEFVGKVVPIQSRSDKELVSHDTKSNNYDYKFTFSVDIVPICREDLICLPPKLANSLGNLGPLVICTKVTNSIALLDPNTLRCDFLTADQYWRFEFECLLSSRRLVEYIVLDIDNISPEVTVAGSRYAMADAQVARVSDFGRNDKIFTIRTHLGHILSPGDYALGYDLCGANHNNPELEKYRGLVLPFAVLIKKKYEEKCPRKHLIYDEYKKFRQDLEENPGSRFKISINCNKESETASEPLAEHFGDLDINDGDEDGGGDDGMSE